MIHEGEISHQILCDLDELQEGDLWSEGVVLLVLGVCALQALIVDNSKRVAACTVNSMQRFLGRFYSLITCIPILHMAPWSPLRKKVRK